MQVLHAADDLLNEGAGFRFFELLLLHDVVEKLATADVLHNQEQLLGRLDDFKQLDNVRVSDHLQDLNFASHALHVCVFGDLSLFKNFDGYLLKFNLAALPFRLSKCECPA